MPFSKTWRNGPWWVLNPTDERVLRGIESGLYGTVGELTVGLEMKRGTVWPAVSKLQDRRMVARKPLRLTSRGVELLALHSRVLELGSSRNGEAAA